MLFKANRQINAIANNIFTVFCSLFSTNKPLMFACKYDVVSYKLQVVLLGRNFCNFQYCLALAMTSDGVNTLLSLVTD